MTSFVLYRLFSSIAYSACSREFNVLCQRYTEIVHFFNANHRYIISSKEKPFAIRVKRHEFFARHAMHIAKCINANILAKDENKGIKFPINTCKQKTSIYKSKPFGKKTFTLLIELYNHCVFLHHRHFSTSSNKSSFNHIDISSSTTPSESPLASS